jgi:hypothetical protein
VLPAAHWEALRSTAQRDNPLRFTICIGIALERFDQIGPRQAIAVNTQKSPAEFLINAGERILQQMLLFGGDDRDVLLLSAKKNYVVAWYK